MKTHSTFCALIVLIFIMLSGCGGGDGSSTNTGSDDASSGSPPEQNDPETTPPDTGTLPFTGTITLDEYDWFGNQTHLGVIDVDLQPLAKRRLFNGSQPRFNGDDSKSGFYTFREPCARFANRIMLADSSLQLRAITPCSNTLPNPGLLPTNFGFSTLSPDLTRLVVETSYTRNQQTFPGLVVYKLADQTILARFENVIAADWFSDGRLLITTFDGIDIVDAGLTTRTRFSTGLSGFVNNIAISPDETTIAFEYNQQIWLIDSDGRNPRARIIGGSALRYPTWSPDGKVLAYLQDPGNRRFEKAIFFTDLTTNESYLQDLRPVLTQTDVSRTVNGPLSWRP